jgi:predicted RNA-binding Zn-ribbon protein involved in translation (DUF1610 family)
MVRLSRILRWGVLAALLLLGSVWITSGLVGAGGAGHNRFGSWYAIAHRGRVSVLWTPAATAPSGPNYTSFFFDRNRHPDERWTGFQMRWNLAWKRPWPSSGLRWVSVPLWIPIVTLLPVLPVLGFVRAKARHGRSLCTRCGYDLAGLTSRTCPECGHESRTEAPHRKRSVPGASA